ncbi:MAG: hypothetical protein RIC55_25800 [Pirellulaceae bacterium]
MKDRLSLFTRGEKNPDFSRTFRPIPHLNGHLLGVDRSWDMPQG